MCIYKILGFGQALHPDLETLTETLGTEIRKTRPLLRLGENPIGVEFDPDRLLERYCNGDSVHELRMQGSA